MFGKWPGWRWRRTRTAATADDDGGASYLEAGDLAQIQERGELRILLPRRGYFTRLPRSGATLDFERQMAESFAEQLGLEPVWVIVDSRNRLIHDHIDKDHARQFADRLVVAVNGKIDLPYLNEDQEHRLLQTVIDPMVKAMISGKKLDDLLPAA